jgi:hypothetical protein
MANSKAAAKLADLVGKRLNEVSAAERAAKIAAFKKVMSEIREAHPKSTKPARTPASSALSRVRG